jgi:hypothetical protein
VLCSDTRIQRFTCRTYTKLFSLDLFDVFIKFSYAGRLLYSWGVCLIDYTGFTKSCCIKMSATLFVFDLSSTLQLERGYRTCAALPKGETYRNSIPLSAREKFHRNLLKTISQLSTSLLSIVAFNNRFAPISARHAVQHELRDKQATSSLKF